MNEIEATSRDPWLQRCPNSHVRWGVVVTGVGSRKGIRIEVSSCFPFGEISNLVRSSSKIDRVFRGVNAENRIGYRITNRSSISIFSYVAILYILLLSCSIQRQSGVAPQLQLRSSPVKLRTKLLGDLDIFTMACPNDPHCVCVFVFIKLPITAQPGPVKLIFRCYSNGSALCVCVCVCVCIY